MEKNWKKARQTKFLSWYAKNFWAIGWPGKESTQELAKSIKTGNEFLGYIIFKGLENFHERTQKRDNEI